MRVNRLCLTRIWQGAHQVRVREAYSVRMQTDAVVLRLNMCRICCRTILLLLSAQCAR